MKFLKIIVFISIGLIIVAGIMLAVFFATFDIEQYKPRIIQELGSLSGRDARIDQLRLDFKIDKGLTVVVKGLSIADDPVFSKEKIIIVDLIDLNTDIPALIFHRQIVISKIEISGPRVHLVRNKDGLLNVQTLFDKRAHGNSILEKSTEGSGSISAAVSHPQNGKKTGTAIPRTFIHAVRIKNGALTFIDESLDPPLTIPLRQIDFQAAPLSI